MSLPLPTPTDMGIFVAALQGDEALLRSLASQHANATTPEGFTPLSLAVSAGHLEASSILLREGAEVDAADKNGVTGASLDRRRTRAEPPPQFDFGSIISVVTIQSLSTGKYLEVSSEDGVVRATATSPDAVSARFRVHVLSPATVSAMKLATALHRCNVRGSEDHDSWPLLQPLPLSIPVAAEPTKPSALPRAG